MLAKEPDRRPQTMREVQHVLETAPRLSLPTIAVAAGALMVGFGVVAAWIGLRDAGERPGRAVNPTHWSITRDPPPAPPPPPSIELELLSTPKATVYLGDDDRPLGETPYKYLRRAAHETLVFVLKAPGYHAERLEVRADQSAHREVTLTALLPPIPSRRARPRSPRCKNIECDRGFKCDDADGVCKKTYLP
jgi:hypothetical protein